MNQAIKDKIEREATAQADDYVEQGWFRLEYSSFGTTAKEVKQSLHTGHVTGATKWAEVALKLREALEKYESCISDDGDTYAARDALAQFDKEVSE